MSDFSRLQQLMEDSPQEAYALLQRLKEKQVVLHDAQREVFDHPARFKVMNAGRRTGKTVLAAKTFISRALKPRQMLWWVAPTYKVVKRGYAEVLRQLPEELLARPAPPDSHFDAGRAVILHFKNGTKMEFYSAERPEGMLGEGVDFAILDEAAIMPGRIWNQVVSPTLMDRQGGALMISTPRGRNWFYQSYMRGQDPEQPRWASWTFTSYSNPNLPDGEVDEMVANMPRLEADQEIRAKFIAAGSSVFHLADEAIQYDMILENNFVEDLRVAGEHIVLGIDLAKTNDYTVIYGARTSDRRNVYFERMQEVTWPEQKRRLKRAVRKLQRAGAAGITLIMDSTGVGDPIVEDMEEAGYDVVPINFTTHKANMVKLLAKDLEEARAFVLEDAMKDEFLNYQMSVTPGGRFTYSAPEGEHDDVVAAKMLQHHGLVNEGVPAATMLSASDPSDAPRPKPVSDDELGEYDEELYDDWDLVDLTDEEADVAIGLPPRHPSPEELMARPEVWF